MSVRWRTGLITSVIMSVIAFGGAHGAPIGAPSQLSGDLTVITFEEFTPFVGGPLSLSGATISASGGATVRTQGFAQHAGIFEGQYFGFGVMSYFIDFDGPVSQFGMGIFDPNFSGNVLRALGAQNQVLETIISPTAEFTLGSPGGGHSTFAGFVRATADITRIELLHASGDVLGIDTVTFSTITTPVPAPGAFALIGIGMLGLVRRRKNVA